MGVFFRVPRVSSAGLAARQTLADGLPRPSSTGLKAAHSSKASLMWGWTKDDSFLRWNWARSARLRVDKIGGGRVVGPRPRAFVVGEEALVRRRRGWGRASSLVVAEHAASFLGLCLLLDGALRRRGQPLPL